MSGVNVLAVLRWASVSADSAKDSREADEARAAVAELIEVASKFPEEPNPYTYRISRRNLIAALARCKGGAA